MGRMHMGMMCGMRGNAPRLSGQRAPYIVDQLKRFADGERFAGVMNRIAWAMTETEMKAVAEFLSGLPD